MKKERGLLLLILVLPVFLSVIAAAQTYYYNYGSSANSVIDSIQNSLTPVLSSIFGGSTDYLFEKLLFFFILLVLLFTILSRFPLFEEKTAIIWIVTIAVTFLATRFMTDNGWFLAIFLPYNVLGIALLSFIPFLIYFFFVEKGIESETMRKIAWIFYAVVFIGIWWSRFSEIGKPAWIFFAAAILSLIMMISDKTIQGLFVRAAIKQGLGIERTKEIVKIQKMLNDDYKLLETAQGDQRRKILKDIAEKEKAVKALSRGPYV